MSRFNAKSLSKYAESMLDNVFNDKENQGQVIQQSPVWIKSTLIGLMGSSIFAVGWLSIAKTDEIVRVNGNLEPLGSVKDVQMPVGGIASEILVKDGEEVKAGQIVMRLDAETTSQRLHSLKESQALKRTQLSLKKTELDNYLLINDEEVKSLTKSYELQKDILNRLSILNLEGAASKLQLLEQENNLVQANGRLNQTKIDRFRQRAILSQQIQQLKTELEEIEARITETAVNLRYQELRSPVDGIVFNLQPRGKGYVAQSTETVMKIVPHETLEASIEIPSRQIGFVKVGMPADLSIDSFPAAEFGVLKGIVSSIGSDALPPSQLENRPDYRYPATVTLSNQRLRLKDGSYLPLQVGMSLTSNIKLRKVSYLQLLLGTFQEKADSLREL